MMITQSCLGNTLCFFLDAHPPFETFWGLSMFACLKLEAAIKLDEYHWSSCVL